MTEGRFNGGRRRLTLAQWALSIMIVIFICISFAFGYYSGTKTNRKIPGLAEVINNTGRMLSLYDVLILKGSISDEKIKALREIYDFGGSKEEFIDKLKGISWVPAPKPAPFVGHMARSNLKPNPFINPHGFRDKRLNYNNKSADTFRIFVTGGSVAYGSGAIDDSQTISALLEKRLNEKISKSTRLKYEVINTAYPAYSTTQEKILINQLLVNLKPDMIIMFSGSNDVHWSAVKRDISWFRSYADINYMSMINSVYAAHGRNDLISSGLELDDVLPCGVVAERTCSNVLDAVSMADRHGIQLIFALQPNIYSTKKELSDYEKTYLIDKPVAYWKDCYRDIRIKLDGISLPNFQFCDFSEIFSQYNKEQSIFIDSYHFATVGANEIIDEFENSVEWHKYLPRKSDVSVPEPSPMTILKYGPQETALGKGFNTQPNGNSAMWFKTEGVTKNVMLVFDGIFLPAATAEGAASAEIPSDLLNRNGNIPIYLIDIISGNKSNTVYLKIKG